MKNIQAPPELLSLLAGELGAGRPVDIPGLGRFTVHHDHAEMVESGDQLNVSPPYRSVRFDSKPKDSGGGS